MKIEEDECKEKKLKIRKKRVERGRVYPESRCIWDDGCREHDDNAVPPRCDNNYVFDFFGVQGKGGGKSIN